jgi:cytochrome c
MSAIRTLRLFVQAALLATAAACASNTPPDIKADIKAESTGKSRGNADNGKAVVMSGCATCHGFKKEDNSQTMVGPSLFGVVGRRAGTVRSLLGPSEFLKKYGVTWTPETLDEFLANPLAILPADTPMLGILRDPQQRADVIAYLATLK